MSNISIFTNSIFTIGGEQRVVALIANELSRNNDVTIYTMDSYKLKGCPFELNEKIAVDYFHPYQYDTISLGLRAATHFMPNVIYSVLPDSLERAYCSDHYAKVMNNLIDDQCDVVIATAWQLSILLGKVKRIYRRLFNAIAWEHSSYEAYFKIKNLYLYNNEYLFANNVKYADKVVVLNEDYKEKYKKHLNIDSIVINNPKSFDSLQKSELLSKHMLYCGRVDENKGIDLLLSAFHIFCKQNQEWFLDIAGDGPMLSKYIKLSKKLGISNRVKFWGRVNNVKDLLLEASFFILPSRFEGFPMSVTEAFEIGVPVLAFDIPGMMPFKKSGGAIVAKCFDSDDLFLGMKQLADNFELRRDMAKKCIAFSRSLSIECIMKKWDELIVEEHY